MKYNHYYSKSIFWFRHILYYFSYGGTTTRKYSYENRLSRKNCFCKSPVFLKCSLRICIWNIAFLWIILKTRVQEGIKTVLGGSKKWNGNFWPVPQFLSTLVLPLQEGCFAHHRQRVVLLLARGGPLDRTWIEYRGRPPCLLFGWTLGRHVLGKKTWHCAVILVLPGINTLAILL